MDRTRILFRPQIRSEVVRKTYKAKKSKCHPDFRRIYPPGTADYGFCSQICSALCSNNVECIFYATHQQSKLHFHCSCIFLGVKLCKDQFFCPSVLFVMIQGVRKILPDLKAKNSFWTLNVIAKIMINEEQKGYCVRIKVYTRKAHRFPLISFGFYVYRKIVKSINNKGIGQYFPNTMYLKILY